MRAPFIFTLSLQYYICFLLTNKQMNKYNLSKTSVSDLYLQSNSGRCIKSSASAQNTHYSRPLCLVLPVDELQVDLGSWAEQAVGFGLDISSQRRHANVEPLNDLPTEQKHRNVRLYISVIISPYHYLHLLLHSWGSFLGGCRKQWSRTA